YLENYIVEDYFLNIRNSYSKSLIAMYLIELIDKTIDFDLPEKKIFNLLVKFLNFLNKEENENKILINLIKFINYYFLLLGYGNLFEFNEKENNISFEEIIKLNEKIEKNFNIELNSIKIK
ncbi:MAG: DNA repair protein RecO C-terminal domain-containing protein, partial [bacterium]